MKDRLIAYNFFKKDLIFISSKEMIHIIQMVYPDYIKRYLIDQTSLKTNIPNYMVKRILNDDNFKELKARSLFLGFSDGAHIDDFRRYSEIRHEQVYPTYLISDIKSNDFIKKLNKYLKNNVSKFEIAFLIDDFSGSGYSFVNKDGDKELDDGWDGKIIRFYRSINSSESLKDLFDLPKLKICVLLYVCTTKARIRIETLCKEYFKKHGISFSFMVIHELQENILVNQNDHTELFPILQQYYTDCIESTSYVKGNMDAPYLGFDSTGLPLILYHNCPNNSLPLLWMDPERYLPLRGLFPRIERFVKE